MPVRIWHPNLHPYHYEHWISGVVLYRSMLQLIINLGSKNMHNIICVYLLQVWPGNCERVEGASHTVCRSPATGLIERRDSRCQHVSQQFFLK